jgi:PAS domain S-box-containing protein
MADTSSTGGARIRGVLRAALGAAATFAIVGVAWILVSDSLVSMIGDPEIERLVQSAKGILFILTASAMVFLLVRRYGNQWERAEALGRLSQEALTRSETRYRSLVERVPGVVWLNEVDRDDPNLTRCIYVSPQLEDLLGHRPEDWMADPDLWERVIHPDDHARVVAVNDRSDEEGRFSVEYRAIHTDGSIVWIHDEAVRIPADGDHPAYWQGVMVDITHQRVQDLALHELTQSLRAVFDASPLAVVVLEPDRTVRHWNPAAERIFGWSAHEVVGSVLLYWPDDREDEVREVFRRTDAGEAVSGLETVRLRKDGTPVDVRLSAAAMFDREGRVAGRLGVLEDITEERRLADERRAAREALATRERQQEAVARLGLVALEGGDLTSLLDEASAVVADTLGVAGSSVLQLLEDDETLLLRSGVGWRAGLAGTYTVSRETPSLAAAALASADPLVVVDASSDPRFPTTSDLFEHGVVSVAATVVQGGRRPHGVLEALSTVSREFSADDVRFLHGVAAILGLAIERERAETATRMAEEKYRKLVEHGPAIVYLRGVDGMPPHVIYMSPQVETLIGYPPESWTGDPGFWESRVHPDDRGRVVRMSEDSRDAGEPLDTEYRMIARDGGEVWVQDRATAIRGPDGTPLFLQGVLVDVSDRRRAEEERRVALERQLRLATRLELLHQIDQDVVSATSIDEMAGSTLDHLKLLVPYDRASVSELDPETRAIRFVAVRSPRLEVEGWPEVIEPTEAERALLAQPVSLIPDLETFDGDSPLAERARAANIRSVLTVALEADGGQVGLLGLSSTRPGAFDEEAVDIAREVGSELAVAIAQMRLRQSLRDRAQELEVLAEERRQMLHRVVRAQEEERERVALELHDGLGQLLTSVALFASDLEDEVPEAARGRAVRVNELIRRAIVDSRQLVWSLRPPELERLGLVAALRRLADEVSSGDLTVDLHEDIGDMRLSPDAEAVVYRVVQEAVHNAQKHSGATAISILLRRQDDRLTTLVEDNGAGFDLAALPPGRGLGLVGMRERAELVEGQLVVESAVGAGTRVRLLVPIGATEWLFEEAKA